MKNIRKLPVLAALLVLTAALTAQEAEIVYIEEQVDVVRDGSGFPADFGTPLRQGDQIRTGVGATAIVRTSAGHELKLQESTEIMLSDLTQQTSVRLERGGLFSRIRRLAGRSFTVRTPSVAAGVRGTEFFMAYGRTVEEKPDVWLCVNEGTVAVAAGDSEVMVNAGEGVNILGSSRITDPRFFSWTQELNWNMDPVRGPVKDDTDLDGAYSDLLDIDYD